MWQTAQRFRLNEKSSAHSLSGGGSIRDDSAGNLLEVIERERREDYFVLHPPSR